MIPETTLQERFGGLQLPALDTVVETTLTPLDPARRILLALFASAINSELGPVWAKVVATLPEGHELKGSTPVVDTLELPPDPKTIGERKEAWPLLALHRSGEGTYEQHTLHVDKLIQKWELHYILGPLAMAEQHKLGDACIAAARIVRMVILEGGHKSFQNGAVQFFDDRASLARIELKSHEGPGPAVFSAAPDAAVYFATTMTLETWEIVKPNLSAYDALEGTDFSINLKNPDEGDTIPDFIEAQV